MTQRELAKKMRAGECGHAGCVICHQDGTISLRWTYFYRHGVTSQMKADIVNTTLPEGWAVIENRDVWKQWPRESYFEVTVRQEAK